MRALALAVLVTLLANPAQAAPELPWSMSTSCNAVVKPQIDAERRRIGLADHEALEIAVSRRVTTEQVARAGLRLIDLTRASRACDGEDVVAMGQIFAVMMATIAVPQVIRDGIRK